MSWLQRPAGGERMAVESTGHSQGNPRLYELIEHAPKTGKSPTVWAWPQLIDYLKVAGQPVQGPWPPHQERRPDPEAESLPTAIPDPRASAVRQPPEPASTAQDLSAEEGVDRRPVSPRPGSATKRRVRSTTRSVCCTRVGVRRRSWLAARA